MRLRLTALLVLVFVTCFGVVANSQDPCILLDEDFSTDVLDSVSWIPSDPSVFVDTANGWLRIASGGGIGDGAHKFVDFSLPIIVETRMRLVSGGLNYTVPNLILYLGPTGSETYGNTYLPDPERGWFFMDEWTQVHTKGPQDENEWVTIKMIIRADGGELLAKSDTDTEFTEVVSREWAISTDVKRVFFRQNWDDVNDIDYVRVCAVCMICPFNGSDVNCDGETNIFDLVIAAGVAFRDESPPPPCCLHQ